MGPPFTTPPSCCRDFPRVAGFIEKESKELTNVKVSYKYAAMPKLILKDRDGQRESIRVDNWKTEHIKEFLLDRLEQQH